MEARIIFLICNYSQIIQELTDDNQRHCNWGINNIDRRRSKNKTGNTIDLFK